MEILKYCVIEQNMDATFQMICFFVHVVYVVQALDFHFVTLK